MKKIFISFILLACLLSSPLRLFAQPSEGKPKTQALKVVGERPRLVLILVIDQFRADYLTRFQKRFLPAQGKNSIGGFNYLMKNGAYFPFAHYDVLQSMTGPGHAMILTGSYPYNMGIPLNEWYSEKLKRSVYCVEDEKSPLVGIAGNQMGISPRNLIGTTVGDELKNSGLKSRVVSIALKDRAAVLLGGHRADLALWFEPKAFQWVSSQFYLKDAPLPDWTIELNRGIQKKNGEHYHWNPSGAETGLSNAFDSGKFSRDFAIGSTDSLSGPYGLELTNDAAIASVKTLHLGKGSAPDVLAISYSSHDYMGHMHGPNAREMEEMTVSEDLAISRLLTQISHEVPGGLSNVLIALTADHGMAPIVPYLRQAGIEAGQLDKADLLAVGEKALKSRFGEPPHGKWIAATKSFNFYFDHESIQEKKLNAGDFEGVLKQELLKVPGVALAFSKSDYFMRTLPPGQHERQILKTYRPEQNGDVVIIPKPFYMEAGVPATHMTGYNYDRLVPLILAGRNIKAGRFATDVDVVDLAPTLSFVLNILPPALSEGRVLAEALR